jgi:hypothetical protein
MRRWAICVALCVAPVSALAEVGAVTEVEGSATRTPKGASAPVALLVGSSVEVGDTLEVAADGNLAVTLADQSVLVLGESSKLEIDDARFGEQDTVVFSARLALGTLWAKVTRLVSGSESKFEITTDRGIAGVRGTVFTVDLTGPDQDLEVGVEEGEVEVAHLDPDAAAAADTAAVRVDRARFNRRERIAAGSAVTFGKRQIGRHKFLMRRARMAVFVGKHRERWIKRAIERERRRGEKRQELKDLREQRKQRR